jgi:hypothetical protein
MSHIVYRIGYFHVFCTLPPAPEVVLNLSKRRP